MFENIKFILIIILICLLLTMLFFKIFYKLIGYLKIGSILDSSNNITDKIELVGTTSTKDNNNITITSNTADGNTANSNTANSNNSQVLKKIYTEFTKEEIEDLTFSSNA